MSRVTNVVVMCDTLTEHYGAFLRSVDRWFREHTGTSLRSVGHMAGGDKNMECSVSIGAFNHLDVDGFFKALPGFVETKRMDADSGFILVTATTQENQIFTWRHQVEF